MSQFKTHVCECLILNKTETEPFEKISGTLGVVYDISPTLSRHSAEDRYSVGAVQHVYQNVAKRIVHSAP